MIGVRLKSDMGVCKVQDSDTGEPIKGVAGVEITQQVGAMPIIRITIVSEDVGKYNVEGDAGIMVKSTTTGEMKSVKSIEFDDGEKITYGEVVS